LNAVRSASRHPPEIRMNTVDEEGTIIALLERFRLQRLPAALEIKSRVDAGGKLTEHDIEFLAQVFEDTRTAQPLLARHPELATLVGKGAALYKEITEQALENEQRG
jgi:hypothetical protein